MDIIKPKAELFLLPAGTREANVAEHQPEYQTLPALITPDGKVVSSWMPDANDLALLNTGVPITLVCWTADGSPQPVTIAVGGLDLR
jgi:hypothetical protein